MAQATEEPTSNNVTPIGRPLTSTERSRIHRQRKHAKPRRKATAPATLPPTTMQRDPATLHQSRTVTTATLIAALALATCSAAFSISGLTSIFAGAFWAVIGLGVAFEIGKLSAVAWLGNVPHKLGNSPQLLRLALVCLVAVLMVLNSIGVYGFLSRAHIEHALAGDLVVSNTAATVEAKLDAKQADLDDIKSRIAQLDQTKTVTHVGKGRVTTTTVGDQGPARAQLSNTLQLAEAEIVQLKIEKAKADGQRKAAEADLGPVRYLATLLGSTDEQTMRYFILVVALLLDPAAVLLLLAATHRRCGHDSRRPSTAHRSGAHGPRHDPCRTIQLGERPSCCRFAAGAGHGLVGRSSPGPPRRHVRTESPMTKEPRVNLDRLVSNIVLDCSLLRWFAYNRRGDEVLAAIALQRTRAKDTEGQVLDFLVRHCGGQQ